MNYREKTLANVGDMARQFAEDGYVVIRGVFSPEEIQEAERELAQFIRDVVPSLKAGDVYFEDSPEKPIKSIFRLEQHSPFFARMMNDERLLRIVGEIYKGADVIQVGTVYFGKAARSGSVTPAHQDNAFQNVKPPEDLVCTIAIDESTPDNGVLTVQRGSQKLGLLPHRPSGVMGFSQMLIEPVDTGKYPEVQLCMKPGDICLHNTNTIHRSGANSTDKSRRQLGFQYRSTRAQRDEAGWARYQAQLKELHDKKAHAAK